MKLVNQIKPLFFVLAGLFALLSITNSGAISHGRMEREAYAKIAADDWAMLELEGFRNGNYDLENQYSRFGSITNNTDRIISLTVNIQPTFLDYKNKNSRFGVKIGSTTREFDMDSISGYIELILLPHETVYAQAMLQPGQNTTVLSSFQFTAADLSGSYHIQLDDTSDNPRRIICY